MEVNVDRRMLRDSNNQGKKRSVHNLMSHLKNDITTPLETVQIAQSDADYAADNFEIMQPMDRTLNSQ